MSAIIETNWTQPPPSGTKALQAVAQMNVTRLNTCTRMHLVYYGCLILQHECMFAYGRVLMSSVGSAKPISQRQPHLLFEFDIAGVQKKGVQPVK